MTDPASTTVLAGGPGPTPFNGGQVARDGRARVWRLQFGPCWCRGAPSSTGSFDFVRLVSSENDLGDFDKNILIVSERVIDGSMAIHRQVMEGIPDPKLVVSAAACPAAGRFWDELPVGWTPVWDAFPVDIRVDECISGMPESLMAAVLRHIIRARPMEKPPRGMAISMGG